LPSHVLGIEGELLGVLAFGAVGAILILMPFLDSSPGPKTSTRLAALFGVALIFYMVLLTYLGYTMNPTK
jgi:quinol-cytochrome oxidoreductase complex cytochrome b subunit